MKLFRVQYVDSFASLLEEYVLADSFDAAAELLVTAGTVSIIKDLGEPLQWEAPAEPVVQPAEPQQPAVSIKKSITPDYLICLDDGLKFKSLKRHLSLLGMTPETYRAKWKLPADYPMVAPAYSAQRSEMAKSFGLGRK